MTNGSFNCLLDTNYLLCTISGQKLSFLPRILHDTIKKTSLFIFGLFNWATLSTLGVELIGTFHSHKQAS